MVAGKILTAACQTDQRIFAQCVSPSSMKRMCHGCAACSAITRLKFLCGEAGASAVATAAEVDVVLAAIVGGAGLMPCLNGVLAGKEIALANKEALVMAGELFVNAAKQKGVRLLPVDSEHSAMFQCLQGNQRGEVDKIILTASGGPFLRTPLNRLDKVSVAQALKHPNWKMGRKITIDSATMMNKGLEVIEARWEFDMEPEPYRRRDSSCRVWCIRWCAIKTARSSRNSALPICAFPSLMRWHFRIGSKAAGAPLDLDRARRVELSAGGKKRFPALSLAYRRVTRGWHDASCA